MRARILFAVMLTACGTGAADGPPIEAEQLPHDVVVGDETLTFDSASCVFEVGCVEDWGQLRTKLYEDPDGVVNPYEAERYLDVWADLQRLEPGKVAYDPTVEFSTLNVFLVVDDAGYSPTATNSRPLADLTVVDFPDLDSVTDVEITVLVELHKDLDMETVRTGAPAVTLPALSVGFTCQFDYRDVGCEPP